MSNAMDRRAPGTARIPFDAMVEVGGALGPSFEAQAVNLSEEGMSLRTAYLPEVGQPVMCRFDAGHGMTVVAAGEVLWNEDMGGGGEFGIRFTNLDAASTVALQRILGIVEAGDAGMDPGRKVRLHIEGLASPMRARIKDQMDVGVTAYSELGFLQMGKPLELEDAASGKRRPALIDRVQIEVEGGSRVPQLVVSLRYDDTDARAAAVAANEVPVTEEEARVQEEPYAHAAEDDDVAPPPAAEQESMHEPAAVAEANDADAHDAALQEESRNLKGSLARNAAKVTPALLSWMNRAKVAAALLAARARRTGATGDDVEIPLRRTTAPAPGGGLHTAGRKVVRGSVPDDHFPDEPAPKSRFKITKKKAAVAGTIGIAGILAIIALRKPAPAPELASAPPPSETAAAAATVAPVPVESPAALPAAKPVTPPADPLAAAAAATVRPGGKPSPFTNGPVGLHPSIIKIKMDGTVEGIQGAPQPTGFTVVIPNRKSLETSQALADKDPRIAAITVGNEASGAEFSVTFKDGVPNYLVRGRGETLELVLAKPNNHGDKAPEAHATRKKHRKKH